MNNYTNIYFNETPMKCPQAYTYREQHKMISEHPNIKAKILSLHFCHTISMVALIFRMDEYHDLDHNTFMFFSKTLQAKFLDTLTKNSDLTVEELAQASHFMVISFMDVLGDMEIMDFLLAACWFHTFTKLEKINIMKLLVLAALLSGYHQKKEALIYKVGKFFNFSNHHIQDFTNEVIIELNDKDKTNPLSPYDNLYCKQTDTFSLFIQSVKNIFF